MGGTIAHTTASRRRCHPTLAGLSCRFTVLEKRRANYPPASPVAMTTVSTLEHAQGNKLKLEKK